MFAKLFSVIHSALGRPQVTTLRGPVGAVNSLSISPCGNLLASGGTDGIRIWDLMTMKEIPVSRHHLHTRERTHISSLRWIDHSSDLGLETLCYGNVLGYLVFLQRSEDKCSFRVVCSSRIGQGGEIIYIATHFTERGPVRLATSTRDKCVQVWQFEIKEHKLSSIHSKIYDKDKDIVPKVLAFDNNRDLFVFGQTDGGIYKYSGDDARSLSYQELKSMIGNAALDLNKRLVVVDNVSDGIDIYHLDTAEYMATFLIPKTSADVFPNTVAFADQSRAVVGGSDHGIVYVFDRKTGHVMRSLKYAKKGGVETLAVHDSRNDDCILVAAASSTSSKATDIRLWRWKPPKENSVETTSSAMHSFRTVLISFAIVSLAIVIIIWQNLSFSMKLVRAAEGTPEHIDLAIHIPTRWMPM